MSSATSTEAASAAPPRAADSITPWQFFLLAGMLSATGVVLVVKGQSPGSIILLSITVVAASLAALGVYRAFSPLVLPEAAAAPPLIVGRTRAALEREKTLVLRSIKELEFDFAMGKMTKADFEEMSGRLRARAIGLMRQLDEEGGYREQIEREVHKRLGTAQSGEAGRTGEAGRAGGSATSTTATGSTSATTCECGTLNDPDARFCKNCGSKLAAA